MKTLPVSSTFGCPVPVVHTNSLLAVEPSGAAHARAPVGSLHRSEGPRRRGADEHGGHFALAVLRDVGHCYGGHCMNVLQNLNNRDVQCQPHAMPGCPPRHVSCVAELLRLDRTEVVLTFSLRVAFMHSKSTRPRSAGSRYPALSSTVKFIRESQRSPRELAKLRLAVTSVQARDDVKTRRVEHRHAQGGARVYAGPFTRARRPPPVLSWRRCALARAWPRTVGNA